MRASFQPLLIGMLACWLALPSAQAQSEPGRNWPEVRETALQVKPGSALDLSGIFAQGELGDKDRLSISGSGFANRAGQASPLHCATLFHGPAAGGFPSHADADQIALELKRRGYNLARFHFADATLMTNRNLDFDYDPEQLDRMYYLMAAVKRQGIYWMVDGMSSANGAIGDVKPHRWAATDLALNLRVFWSENARNHWAQLVRTMWGRVNPYTKASTLADPALLGVILVNENNIRFLERTAKVAHPELVKAFKDWLDTHRDEGLAAHWSDSAPPELFAAAVLRELQKPGGGPRSQDFDRFVSQTEEATYKRLTAELVKLGYTGPATMFHVVSDKEAQQVRSTLGWIDMHAYHDHPSAYVDAGSRIRNVSSLAGTGNYLEVLTAARIADRPFTVSEYGHPFWNSYRHEAALLIPWAASVQRWSALCRMTENAVNLSYGSSRAREQLLTPFMTGLDPVARAGETVAALLYRRGDAARALPGAGLAPPAAADVRTPRSLRLVSQKTEAAVVEKGSTVQLDQVRIQSATTRVAVSLSDISNAPSIHDSRRLLLVATTDALNTGMRFTDDSRQVIQEPGRLPVRVEPVSFVLSVRLKDAGRAKAYALSLTGERGNALPTRVNGDTLELDVSNVPAGQSPTPFFEIAVE